jgi:hypothetical protein
MGQGAATAWVDASCSTDALAPLVAELVLAVALEEITDGLDANLDRAGRTVLIQILEGVVRTCPSFR